MSLLGAQGLHQVAELCHHNTHELLEALTAIEGVELVFSAPYFHEALIRFRQPVDKVLTQLAEAGIAGGYALAEHYPQQGNTLLVCATEMRTAEEIAHYAHTLKTILSQGNVPCS